MVKLSNKLKRELFYRVVEALEHKIAVSAYYSVELACQHINISPSALKQKDLPKLVNSILDLYKEYYPHRIADIGNHLSMVLLQNADYQSKRNHRKWLFFR